ncbi:hypothetical protein Tco_0860575 [Tanacetum coccineum]|uniref:Uncharacterized protein n=1 Tax=Tanacetum coccineum TaxID=301880 RepID=A0ABQ5BJ37_9ASTR
MANTQYRQYQYCTCYNGSESVHASELNSGSLHVAATSFPCDTWSPFKPFLAFAFLLLSKFLAVKKLVVVVGSLVLLRKMISGGVIGFGYLFSFVSCSCMTFWVGSEAIDVGAYEIRGVMFDNTGPCSVGAVATSAKWVRILGHSFSTGFLYFLLLVLFRRNAGEFLLFAGTVVLCTLLEMVPKFWICIIVAYVNMRYGAFHNRVEIVSPSLDMHSGLESRLMYILPKRILGRLNFSRIRYHDIEGSCTPCCSELTQISSGDDVSTIAIALRYVLQEAWLFRRMSKSLMGSESYQ